MTLEERIEAACEHLPEGWRINIEVEKGSGIVRMIRPDETFVIMGDGEDTIAEQFDAACLCARDEVALKRLEAEAERIGEMPQPRE